MKKRIVFWALPILLCISVFHVRHLQYREEHKTELWLQQQAQNLEQIEILDGLRRDYKTWNSITITDQTSILRIVDSLRAQGNLTETNPKQAMDDGVLGYNRSYFITLFFKTPQRHPEYLVINPSNDRQGIYLLNRRADDSKGNSINIIDCADMNEEQFEEFKKTLDSISRP